MTDDVSSGNQSSDLCHPVLNCGGKPLDLSYPHVMAVLNVTPDSFSDGGAFFHSGEHCNLDKALNRAEQMIAEGASIIDIGGESTRPGAAVVSLQEEMDRVLPVVEAVNQRFDSIISVDTSSAELMLAAAKSGAGMLNDVRALTKPGAIEAAADTGLPVCLMHMRGKPQTMQVAPRYSDVVRDVCDYLRQRVEQCIAGGVENHNIILDPGFGFGKTVEHNLLLLNRLTQIVALGYPVLVGLSRKSLIGKVLGRDVDERLAGSLALATLAVSHGASIVRVHDVAQTVDAVRLCYAVANESL